MGCRWSEVQILSPRPNKSPRNRLVTRALSFLFGTVTRWTDSPPFIDSGSISFVYSFDSMVHFDKSIIRAYLVEFARVMRGGATGFLHHSNYGAFHPNTDWAWHG